MSDRRAAGEIFIRGNSMHAATPHVGVTRCRHTCIGFGCVPIYTTLRTIGNGGFHGEAHDPTGVQWARNSMPCGRFKDTQTYKRTHGMDIKRKSKSEKSKAR